MKTGELENYRKALLSLQKRLDGEVSRLRDEAMQGAGGEASGGISDVPLHLGDLGSHAFDQEVTLSLVENEEFLRQEIEGALNRIEQNTFGKCEDCQKDIVRERLQVLPYARHCVSCAEKHQNPRNRR